MENIQEAAGNHMPFNLMAVCREVNKIQVKSQFIRWTVN